MPLEASTAAETSEPMQVQGMPHPWSQAWSEGLFSGFGLLLVALQLFCVIHVYRTGRPFWWVWVIFAVPGLGAVAYLLLELRPSWGRLNWKAIAWRLKSPAARIRIREELVEESPTQAHRLQLANELIASGQYQRASDVLRAGLHGVFNGDAELLLRLIDCQLALGQAPAAAASLAGMEEVRDANMRIRRRTAEARVAGVTGQLESADALFRELLKQDRTEAPRYYYGEMLLRAGRRAEGRQVLEGLIKRYRKGSPLWRAHERQWYQLSQRLLKANRSER
jgi:hypothetical protein